MVPRISLSCLLGAVGSPFESTASRKLLRIRFLALLIYSIRVVTHKLFRIRTIPNQKAKTTLHLVSIKPLAEVDL